MAEEAANLTVLWKIGPIIQRWCKLMRDQAKRQQGAKLMPTRGLEGMWILRGEVFLFEKYTVGVSSERFPENQLFNVGSLHCTCVNSGIKTPLSLQSKILQYKIL